jgi:predicted enzyme related to lactoylglutathione lyase
MKKHPVVWFEVMANDGEKLQSFYGKLFDWKIDASNPMKYGMVEAANGQGIPGGIGQLEDKPWPKVTFYVSTTDIDASLKKATELGGKVLMPRTKLPAGVVLGMFADPEGNAIGLAEEAEG